MGLIFAIVKLLIILCIVATVHEFGHFIAAKLLRTGVREFSIGFGPKIVQKKFRETMYSLRWLPLGGYVQIEGEGEESDSENSLEKKSPLSKVIILVMGMGFNCLLAFIILISIAFSNQVQTTTITELDETSPLYESGLRVGDEIVAINDDKTNIAEHLIDTKYNDAEYIIVKYIRDGEEYTSYIENAIKEVGYVGIVFKGVDDEGYPLVEMIRGGKAAEKAGIKVGDAIVSINNEKVIDVDMLVEIIQENGDNELAIQVKRNNEIKDLVITPNKTDIFDLEIGNVEMVQPSFSLALEKSTYIIGTVFKSYGDFITGNVSIDDVSSVVGIGAVVSRTEGLLDYIYMLAVISLAIGVANVLPIPPLDGGKIVIVLFEALTNKKVSLKVETIISYIGFGLLILLAIVVTCKDIMRLI